MDLLSATLFSMGNGWLNSEAALQGALKGDFMEGERVGRGKLAPLKLLPLLAYLFTGETGLVVPLLTDCLPSTCPFRTHPTCFYLIYLEMYESLAFQADLSMILTFYIDT